MKVIILAGGQGTRLAEETETCPKPMVEIGGRPILWHVMSIYGRHGYSDFLVACGYRGQMIKEYFNNYVMRVSDSLINFQDGSTRLLNPIQLDWTVGIFDTGVTTMTGGRILRLRPWTNELSFMVTYGDGVGDIDIPALVDFHTSHGKLATVTAVRPPSRFGALALNGDAVSEFSEKPQSEAGWINGGFFVFEQDVFDYLEDDNSILERGPLERLAQDGQLMAYRHRGFWQCMDTLRDKQLLETLWQTGKAPWK